ncbi:unnamed protein product [Bursaphelenchus okinawaensis]|uniref:EF-hand domain-containing protein n=1 Tax=Bursaphelenchus okinawaensis TaxID=465554 RepID=A0A811KCM0_9BILA|nr:unnamed protein product [Bursaphelenchus okinawaensis]CAG9098486.1 unnamed protein product [Bursaphelenchus okinawaensis]
MVGSWNKMSGASSLWLILIVLVGTKVAFVRNDEVDYSTDHLKDKTCEENNPGKTCVELEQDDFGTYFVSMFLLDENNLWTVASTFSVNGSAFELFAEDNDFNSLDMVYYYGFYIPPHENEPWFYHVEKVEGRKHYRMYQADGAVTWRYEVYETGTGPTAGHYLGGALTYKGYIIMTLSFRIKEIEDFYKPDKDGRIPIREYVDEFKRQEEEEWAVLEKCRQELHWQCTIDPDTGEITPIDYLQAAQFGNLTIEVRVLHHTHEKGTKSGKSLSSTCPLQQRLPQQLPLLRQRLLRPPPLPQLPQLLPPPVPRPQPLLPQPPPPPQPSPPPRQQPPPRKRKLRNKLRKPNRKRRMNNNQMILLKLWLKVALPRLKRTLEVAKVYGSSGSVVGLAFGW